MFKTLVCPQCGATMKEVDGGNKAVCEFCGTSVILAETVNHNVNVSGSVTMKKDMSNEPNVIIDFSTVVAGGTCIVQFNTSNIKKALNNGQTAYVRLPLGRTIATISFGGKNYRREIFVVEDAPVRITVSHIRGRDIDIEQPPYEVVYNQETNASPFVRATAPVERKKPSVFSVLGFIFSFFPYLSVVGVVLAIVDIIKMKDRPKGLTIAACIIGGLMTLAMILKETGLAK